MRNLIRCIPLAVAAGVLAAQSSAAQEPRPNTHTVVRGDNLWDLSQRYLGNPFLWPEIYRLNRDVIEDPHWIFPGEVLRLPGPEPTVAAAPPAPGTPRPPAPAPVGALETTVFGRVQPPTTTQPIAGVPTAELGMIPPPTVRPGEVIAAPYVDREGGPRGWGRILKSGDIPGIASAERTSFQAHDRLFISPPVAQVAPEGERYLTYRLGPTLEGQGQIVIPTGVIEVTRAARSDVAAVARVVRAFAEIRLQDRLIPLDTAGITSSVRPQRVSNGPSTTVKWVYGEPVLPSVQSYVVLAVSAREGIRMGDEFLIYQPQTRAEIGRPSDPEIPIGKAQVVRATSYGVTAVVLGQEQPAIKEGMAARVTARMP